ncbi:MAG: HU family DNA-binding protein [Prevotella sp.]|nr:HU family DNA-binding protein [Prevotella sp.]
MSVFYRLHQDQSTGTKRSGKWYARAVPTAVINTRQLAEIVQRNCTVKRSDVVAVIEEMVEVMKDQMQDSKRVKLDGFGSFKIGIQSKGAQTAGKFSVAEHVKGLRVVFMPERTKDSSGNRSKQFLQGARVEELPLNTVVKEDEPEP